MDYRDPKWVAGQLGLEKNTVYKLLQDGTLPAVQIGRKWLISESQLAEYLAEEARLQTTLRRTVALPHAEKVLGEAHAQAARYRHGYVGQEHILLALTIHDGPAKDILSQMGADQAKVRSLFEAQLAPGAKKARGKPPLTRRARRALCLAAEEAQRAGRVTYGPEHLLLGLLRTNEGAGFQMLTALGIHLDAVRPEIARHPKHDNKPDPDHDNPIG